MDDLPTSIVLNIAEGNGRFSPSDHRKFIDMAHQSAPKSLVPVDLVTARRSVETAEAQKGKDTLGRVVKMLMGMRGYLQGEAGR